MTTIPNKTRVVNLLTMKLGVVEAYDAPGLRAEGPRGEPYLNFREYAHWGHAVLPGAPVPEDMLVAWPGTLPEAQAIVAKAAWRGGGDLPSAPQWATWKVDCTMPVAKASTFRFDLENGGYIDGPLSDVRGALVAEARRIAEANAAAADIRTRFEPPPDDPPPPPPPDATPASPPSEWDAKAWIGSAIFGGIRRKVALALVTAAVVIDPLTVATVGLLAMAKVGSKIVRPRSAPPDVEPAKETK